MVEIESECVHCGQPLYLVVNSELAWHVQEGEATLLVFEPDVDFAHLTAPTIINDY